MYELEFRRMHERHCVQGRKAVVLDPQFGDFPVAVRFTDGEWRPSDPEYAHMALRPQYIATYKPPADFEPKPAQYGGEFARYPA